MSGDPGADRTRGPVGEIIRRWRGRRRWSQQELAFEVRVSPRHMSFVETGRSNPSREVLLAIATALEIPLRERNVLLEAAGFAREYSDAPFDAERNEHLRSVVERLLAGHEPWFAVAVDPRWDILLANDPADAFLERHFEEGDVPGPRNLMRLTLHPAGLRPAIVNLDAVAGRLLHALEREATLRPHDDALAELLEEVEGYGPEGRGRGYRADGVPLRLRTGCGEARILTVLMTFDDPLDPVTEEVRIETLLPADAESEAVLREALAMAAP